MSKLSWIAVVFFAAWSWATMAAYLGTPDISQLEEVGAWLTPTMWSWAWGITATVLTIGLLPVRYAANVRALGLILVASLCAAWATSFFLSGGRGWVSGKNYALFMVLAVLSAYATALTMKPDRSDKHGEFPVID